MGLYRAGVFFAALLSVPCIAWGSLVIASGAGALLPGAEDLSGVNVTEIQGSLTTDPTSVSLFEIDIQNAFDFSALMSGMPAFLSGYSIRSCFIRSLGCGSFHFNDDISGSDTLVPPAVYLRFGEPCPEATALGPCPRFARY